MKLYSKSKGRLLEVGFIENPVYPAFKLHYIKKLGFGVLEVNGNWIFDENHAQDIFDLLGLDIEVLTEQHEELQQARPVDYKMAAANDK